MHATRRQMSLGLSIANLGYHYAAWRHPDVPAGGNMDFRHFVHCAKLAERRKFDLIFLVRDLDNLAIARDMEHQLVKHEPMALLAALSTVTSRVGLVPTASTTYNDPYTLTRTLATLDILSEGRAGWNLVTSFSIDEARNFGLHTTLDSASRHARAAESAEVMLALFDSWEPDAAPRDKASGIYFDRDKLHVPDHVGMHFKVRGPLDVPRPPQAIFRSLLREGPSRLRNLRRILPMDCTRGSRISSGRVRTMHRPRPDWRSTDVRMTI
jgi:alkanesulfonate monooxygenase SsuD/methylene tetrahydromethanopterin reductase-like flavin-dependent oxidoreductase (luciferase family)